MARLSRLAIVRVVRGLLLSVTPVFVRGPSVHGCLSPRRDETFRPSTHSAVEGKNMCLTRRK
jgi:hypothetical protein